MLYAFSDDGVQALAANFGVFMLPCCVATTSLPSTRHGYESFICNICSGLLIIRRDLSELHLDHPHFPSSAMLLPSSRTGLRLRTFPHSNRQYGIYCWSTLGSFTDHVFGVAKSAENLYSVDLQKALAASYSNLTNR